MDSPAKPSLAAPATASRRYLVTHREHHARMMPYVDALPELAEMLGRSEPLAFAERLEDECDFILGEMLPHIVTIEETLYPQLDRMMDKRHTMQPMREEHAQLRSLVESLCHYRLDVAAGRLDEADAIGLRRILYRLYALVKVHLAEEELYLGVRRRKEPTRTRRRPRLGGTGLIASPPL